MLGAGKTEGTNWQKGCAACRLSQLRTGARTQLSSRCQQSPCGTRRTALRTALQFQQGGGLPPIRLRAPRLGEQAVIFRPDPIGTEGDAVESSLSLPYCRNSARQWEPRGRLALQRTWEKAVSAPARQGGVGSSATLSALQGVYHRALGARLEETQSNRCDPKALLERGDTAGKGLKPARRRRFSTCGSPGRVPPAQLADC